MNKIKEENLTIKLHEFHYDEKEKLYVLPESLKSLYLGFNNSNRKDEERNLKFIQTVSKIKQNSEDLHRSGKELLSPYQLGIGRSNIIKCFNLPSESTILDLTSGSGAITRYLGENFQSVDCVESSYMRAKSIQEHTRTLNNVKIFYSNIKWIQFEPLYDIVILIGLSEYSSYIFPNKENPLIYLLEIAKSALKPNGVILLAIDNKIGLKYWNGYPENNTGTPFDSINGYPRREFPLTFSKREIKELLQESGFSEISFFYCYPDYEYATEIFSDLGDEKELYLHNWVTIPFWIFDKYRNLNFHEGLALKSLSVAGLMRELANSFLIIASNNSSLILESDWVVKKFSINRSKEYQCITTLRLTPYPQIDKARLFSSSDKPKRELIIGGSSLKLTHQISNSNWEEGDLLLYDLYKLIFQDNFTERVKKLLEEYYKRVIKRYLTGEKDIEGFPLLKGDSMDLIFRNIIRDKTGNLIPIDLEWVVDGCIPADYVVYRCIFHDINTIIGFHFPNRIQNLDQFCIDMVKTIFPNYESYRHLRNVQTEELFQKSILPVEPNEFERIQMG